MKRLITALLVCMSFTLLAQDLPFWNEIKAFKTADSLNRPPRKGAVFVGSSSFRMWKNIENDFPGHAVINRGFGGSSLPHVIQYADEIITPYRPKQVVVYCGENDFITDTVTSQIVAERFKHLFTILRQRIPRAHIIFVSMKPSPSRRHLMDEIAAANALIREFVLKQKRAAYVDIWQAMLDKDGAPRRDLFLQDMLHMNASGYAIWKKAIGPHLK